MGDVKADFLQQVLVTAVVRFQLPLQGAFIDSQKTGYSVDGAIAGGQCLGCLPPDEPTEMTTVGKLSMLMDSEGLIQVKVDDGLFEIYQPLAFGYGAFEILDADSSNCLS